MIDHPRILLLFDMYLLVDSSKSSRVFQSEHQSTCKNANTLSESTVSHGSSSSLPQTECWSLLGSPNLLQAIIFSNFSFRDLFFFQSKAGIPKTLLR